MLLMLLLINAQMQSSHLNGIAAAADYSGGGSSSGGFGGSSHQARARFFSGRLGGDDDDVAFVVIDLDAVEGKADFTAAAVGVKAAELRHAVHKAAEQTIICSSQADLAGPVVKSFDDNTRSG